MLHKIVEVGGERYLPFALSKIRALKKLGLPFVSQRYVIEGFVVRAELMGTEEYVRISADPGPYEFHCPDTGVTTTHGPTSNSSLYTDSFSAFVRGCGVQVRGAAASAIYSNALASTDPSVSWTMLPVPAGPLSAGIPRTEAFSTGGPPMSYKGTAWQNQRYAEYVWWHNNTDQLMSASCLAIGQGSLFQAVSTFACATGTTWTTDVITDVTYHIGYPTGGGIDTYAQGSSLFLFPDNQRLGGRGTDEMEIVQQWDIPPALYTSVESVRAGYKRAANANWRRAAIQRVLVNGVYVNYAIASDRHGSFCCYRMRPYTAGGTYGLIYGSDTAYVKTVTPSYPAWCAVNPDSDVALDHWVFTFNKDGTKAVTTPFEKVDAYMWVGAETVSRTGGVLDFIPFCSVPGDRGGWSLPSAGADGWTMLWPITPGTDIHGTVIQKYTVTRERVYRVAGLVTPEITADGSAATLAVNIQGSYYDIAYGRHHAGHPLADSEGFMPALDPATLEPAFTCKPGLLELGFTITVNPANLDDFAFAVTVLQEEAYSVNKRFYFDAGYYAPDGRTKAMKGMPAEDTLLVAELEVSVADPLSTVTKTFAAATADFSGHAYPLVSGSHITGRSLFVAGEYASHGDTTLGANPVREQLWNIDKADEPNCEAVFLSSYQNDINVQYVVRDRATQTEFKRFSLVDGVSVSGGKFNQTNPIWAPKPAHFSSIVHANLRTLNYITKTFSSPAHFLDSSMVFVMENLLAAKPRYELRINGMPTKTVNYSTKNDFANDPDPMTNQSTLSGFTKLPYRGGIYANGWNASSIDGTPDSFLLYVQLWAFEALIGRSVFDNISTHPDGSWACHYRTDGNGYVMQPDSTEKVEAFDYIVPAKGKASTHKSAFNSAFKQTRDYSDYQTIGDYGSFCTFGVWYKLSTLKGPTT